MRGDDIGILTLDTLIILLKNTLFNPTLTLPVLLTLQYVPAAQELVRTYDDKQELLKRFRTLVVLGVLGRLNALLSWGALNNWRRVKFNPADEIAVVTGGAQGIGMSIVKGLSAAGIKVVVLDIQPLSYTPGAYIYRLLAGLGLTSWWARQECLLLQGGPVISGRDSLRSASRAHPGCAPPPSHLLPSSPA